MLFDVSLAAFIIHPNPRITVLAGGFGVAGKILDLDAVSNASFLEIAVQQPLRLIGRRWTSIRTQGYTDNNAAPVKRRKGITQANRTIQFPRINGRFSEARNEIWPNLHPEGHD